MKHPKKRQRGVSSKRKLDHTSIVLLVVGLVAVLALFFVLIQMRGDGAIAGQAIGDVLIYQNIVGQEVYIQGGYFGGYMCVYQNGKLNLCSDRNDKKGTLWVIESAGDGKFYLKHVEKGLYLFAKSGEHHRKQENSPLVNDFLYVTSGKNQNGNIWTFESKGTYDFALKSASGQYLLFRDSESPITPELIKKYYSKTKTGFSSYSSTFRVLEAKSKIKKTPSPKDNFPSTSPPTPSTDDNSDPSSSVSKTTFKSGDTCEAGTNATSLLYCQDGKLALCTSKPVVSKDGKAWCDGKKWGVCKFIIGEGNTFGHLTTDKKNVCRITSKGEGDWLACNVKTEGKVAVNSLCEAGKWNKCGKANQGDFSKDQQYFCETNVWVKDVVLDKTKFFETKINDKGKKVNGVNVFVCDKNSKEASLVDVCLGKETAPVRSLTSLQKVGKVAHYQFSQFTDVVKKTYGPTFTTLIYGVEKTPKTASVILTLALNNAQTITRQNFVNNFGAGLRLGLVLDKEKYLLRNKVPGKLFKFENLELLHIKSGQVYSAVHKGAENYEFAIPINPITLVADEINVKISSNVVGEAIAGAAQIANLNTSYEVPFMRGSPAKLKDLKDTLISVCGNLDSPAFTDTLYVCQNNGAKELVILNEGVLTPVTITYNGGSSIDVIFLYQYDSKTNTKKGYVFRTQVVDKTGFNFAHQDFVKNLVEGRRVTIKFEGEYYLMSHPIQTTLDLTKLVFTTYKDVYGSDGKYLKNVVTHKTSSGTKRRVESLVSQGKLIVEQDQAKNQPPFNVSGRTKTQLAKQVIDLTKTFFTTFSSQVPVYLGNPGNLAMISVHKDDITGDKSIFKISTDGGTTYNLELGKPTEISETLFYYDKFVASGDTFVKDVRVYYVKNLASNQDLAYTKEFLHTFTNGNEFALKFGSSYYLVGFKGIPGALSMDDVTLSTLDGTTIKVKKSSPQEILFDVPEGEINLTSDSPKNKLYLRKISKDDLNTKNIGGEKFSAFLTPDHKVVLGGTTYEIQDTIDTKNNSGLVLVSKDGSNKGDLFVVDVPLANYHKDYLFWYRGVVNGKKTISIHDYKDISNLNQVESVSGWGNLLENAVQSKSKVIKWQKKFFELVGTKTLSDFSLQVLPQGELKGGEKYKIVNPQNLKDPTGKANIGENGTFVFGEHLLFAEQKLNQDFKSQLQLQWIPQRLLTPAGLNTSLGGVLVFTLRVDGPVYTLNFEATAKDLVGLSLKFDSKLFYKQALPEGVSSKVLLPSGEIVTLKVVNATSQPKLITLTK